MMTPELLASMADPSTGSGTAIPSAGDARPGQARWKKVAAAIGTAAVTLALGGLLLARGGGGRSQARMRAEAAPATAAVPPVIQPVIAPTTTPSPAGAAPEEAAPPKGPTEEAVGDDDAHKGKSAHRHHGSHRQHAQSDRVARGLSIDPFKP